MIIIGVDFHPEFQQIAMVDTETGELQERRLQHPKEAESFYRELVKGSAQLRVGMEASGHGRWFERLMGELQIELWVGDAAEIRTKRVRKQKTDRQDAQLILKLMLRAYLGEQINGGKPLAGNCNRNRASRGPHAGVGTAPRSGPAV